MVAQEMDQENSCSKKKIVESEEDLRKFISGMYTKFDKRGVFYFICFLADFPIEMFKIKDLIVESTRNKNNLRSQKKRSVQMDKEGDMITTLATDIHHSFRIFCQRNKQFGSQSVAGLVGKVHGQITRIGTSSNYSTLPILSHFDQLQHLPHLKMFHLKINARSEEMIEKFLESFCDHLGGLEALNSISLLTQLRCLAIEVSLHLNLDFINQISHLIHLKHLTLQPKFPDESLCLLQFCMCSN